MARHAFEQAVLEHLESLGKSNEELRKELIEVKKMVTGNGTPEAGALSRLRDVEKWQKNVSRVLWIGITAFIGILATYFFTLFEIVSELKKHGLP